MSARGLSSAKVPHLTVEQPGGTTGSRMHDGARWCWQGPRQYRASMTGYAAMLNLEVWYSHIDIEAELQKVQSQLDRKRAKAVEKNIAKTRARDNVQAFAKLTDEQNGEPRIVIDPPLIVPIEELTPVGMSRDDR